MKNTFFILLLMFSFKTMRAQEKELPLYPNGVPNAKATPADYVEKHDKDWITLVSVPTITPYLPPAGTANGTAIIIFPGGSYIELSMVNEGSSVAQRCYNGR
jgi:hypothetical protein